MPAVGRQANLFLAIKAERVIPMTFFYERCRDICSAILESVTGMMYMAVFVARLIGVYSAVPRPSEARESKGDLLSIR